jgi:alpha-glucoside transport system substrate-binding protein
MMKRLFVGFTLVAAMLLSIGAWAQQVSIAVLWSGDELDAFKSVIRRFEVFSGIDVVIDEVGRDLPTVLPVRVAAGNPPDLAALPNPGQMKEFAEQGALVALDDLENLADHSAAFVDLGTVTVDGEAGVYGFFIAADLKSLVWYNPKTFEANGYEVPTNWPELIALSDQIVADGRTPWAIGFESGPASGWPGTDWIEDIMLRTAGPELYDQWVNHEIPWTHPAVKKAWEYFGQIVNASGYVYGGPVGALTIFFGDSPAVMFDTPPGAFMHRQATFIQSFILGADPDLVPVEDYNVFVFPPISPVHGNPLLGAGDLIGVFNGTPEALALADYLASAEAQELWCGALGKLATNTNVDPSVYPDPITANAAALLAEAETFRFDASDLMPAAVGSGTFWTGILDYISGISLDTVLEAIEASAVSAYGD